MVTDEFRRLLDDAPSAELRGVLESAACDQPSPRALTRAARTLGIGTAGLGLAQAAAAGAGSRASTWAALAKWGGVGILLGGVALSPLVLNAPASSPAKVVQPSAAHVRPGLPEPSPREPAQAPLPAEAALAVPTASALPALPASPALPWLPARARLAGVAPTTPTTRSPSPAPIASALPIEAPIETPIASVAAQSPLPSALPVSATASVPNAPRSLTRADLLDSEVALLDSTRSALKRRDPDAALGLLDRQARLSVRSLSAEATVLRVQALLLAGRSDEARNVARAALAAKSDGPYATRLRKLAGLVE